MENIYSIHPDFTFDTNDSYLLERYGIDTRHTSRLYFLNNQKWYDYCKLVYGFKIPGELRANNPNLELISNFLNNGVLQMPEPLSYCGIRDLILSTDMPKDSGFFTISKRLFSIVELLNCKDNFVQIPTRVFLFDHYPNQILDKEWDEISSTLDFTDDFISIVNVLDPINVFEPQSLIKEPGEFFWRHKKTEKVVLNSALDYSKIPPFLKFQHQIYFM
jgi:hypothetical protein